MATGLGSRVDMVDAQTLYRALQAATSNDGEQRKIAQQNIVDWEGKPGYYSGLQSIFQDKTVLRDIRLMAIIQFKNGIDKYWRLSSHAKNAIPGLDKSVIRDRLYSSIVNEEDRTLMSQAALAAGKIVRIDQTKEWPEALSTLVETVRNLRSQGPGSSGQLMNAFHLLLAAIKELLTARSKITMRAWQSLTPQIICLCLETYSQKKTAWYTYLTTKTGDRLYHEYCMSITLVTLRLARRLIVHAVDVPSEDPNVEALWIKTMDDLDRYIPLVQEGSDLSKEYREMVEKHIMQFTKLHTGVAEQHPVCFVNLPNSINMTISYWNQVVTFADLYEEAEAIQHIGTEVEKTTLEPGSLMERIALKGLILMRHCLSIAFQTGTTLRQRSDDYKEKQNRVTELLKTVLFTNDFVRNMTSVFLGKLFVFRRTDMDEWQNSPEEWEARESTQGNAYEIDVRACAEKLFLDLLVKFKTNLSGMLVSYFKSVLQGECDVASKDSVYTALGISAAFLVGQLDLNEFIRKRMMEDLKIHDNLACILRRRLILLSTQLIGLDISANSRAAIYELFSEVLNLEDPRNDQVVRLTAARELARIAEHDNFDLERFVPFAQPIVVSIITTVECTSSPESKLAQLESVRIVSERLGHEVSVVSDFLMLALPAIWKDGESEERMVQQAIMAIFAAFVASLGVRGVKYHHNITPVVREVLRPGSELSEFLTDEALDLLSALLQFSPVPFSEDLVELYGSVLPLVGREEPTCSCAMEIIEAYLTMAPSVSLDDRFRSKTFSALSEHISSKKRELSRPTIDHLQLIIRNADTLGKAAGVATLLRDMADTKVLQEIMANIYDSWTCRQDHGPNQRHPKLSQVQEAEHLAVICRILYSNPRAFFESLIPFGPFDQVWGWLFDEIYATRDGGDNSDRRKLFALAVARSLLVAPVYQAIMLQRLEEMLVIFNECLIDVKDNQEGPHDCLLRGEYIQEEYDTPKSLAAKQIEAQDPVYCVSAPEFLRLIMEKVSQQIGLSVMEEEYFINVDARVLNTFKQLI